MGQKPTKAISSTIEEKTNKLLTSTTSVTASSSANIKQDIYQNFRLVWLDASIDKQNQDYQNSFDHLHRIVNSIVTYTDANECVEFLNQVKNEKVFMIVSGSLGQTIVADIRDLPQLDSIFVFCGNKSFHERWAQKCTKVKGVFTDIVSICKELQPAVRRCDQHSVPVSFLLLSLTSNPNFNQLDPSFMCIQLFKEIILQTDDDHVKAIENFAKYCRVRYIDDCQIKEFEQEYFQKTAISWYTSESFITPMLNWALRTLAVDTILKMGFFIRDLHRHIEKRHKEQVNNYKGCFTVYRGQGLSEADSEKLEQTKGGLMSFDNFLCTSRNRKVSKDSARSALTDPNSVGILFVMTIDPTISANPFAVMSSDNTQSLSEQDILFSIHTVFHIDEIKKKKDCSRLWEVKLTLISIDDQQLHAATKLMQDEIWGLIGFNQLSELLFKFDAFEKAEEVCSVLLEQESDASKRVSLCQQLGRIQRQQGMYQEAILSYKKALKIRQNMLPPNHVDLADSYISIGLVYQNMGQYSNERLHYEKAHKYYKKALDIVDKTLSSNQLILATCYNHIGNVNYQMGNDEEALSYHEKALEIRTKALPGDHPILSDSYNNIGLVYINKKEYSKALLNHEKALQIRQKARPPNYPSLAGSYNNIGLTYERMDKDSDALSSFNDAITTAKRSLPSNHPHLEMYERNYERLKEKQQLACCHNDE